MATKIEYCDETWNPVTGCTPIGAGCKNCWAKRWANRQMGPYKVSKGQDPFAVRVWPERFDAPLHWRKPRVVAVCLMGDLFHERVKDHSIGSIVEMMAACKKHRFIVLTKRPKRMAQMLHDDVEALLSPDQPSGHIWLGTSVSTQKDVDAAVEPMSRLAAAGWNTWVSAEPLLERVDLRRLLESVCQVIVGGESGPGWRPMETEWVQSLQQQCGSYGVPFFFKQWAGMHPKKLGRKLDGREHNDLAWRMR